MKDRWLLSWTLALAVTVVAPGTGSAGAWIPVRGEYGSEFTGSHESRTFGYDDDGNAVGFPFRLAYQSNQIRAFNELGWKKRMSFILSIPVTSVTTRSSIQALSQSNTGLSDMVLGLHYGILDGSTALSIQADWKIPMGYDSDVVAPLGDGLNHFSAELDAGTSIPVIQGFVEGSIGYLTRIDLHLHPPKDTHPVGAPVIGFSADAAVWAGPSVLLVARYAGSSSSAQNDQDVDRSVHAVGPEVRYRVDEHMDVFVGSSFTFSGRNVDKVKTFYLGLALKQTRLNRLQGFLGGTRRP